MDITTLPFLLKDTIISILGAITLSFFLNGWVEHFKFPLIREFVIDTNSSGTTTSETNIQRKTQIHFKAASAIFIFYFLVGFFLLIGLVNPLIPESIPDIHISSLELAFIGLTMVGLIRLLTLFSSLDVHRILVDGLTLSTGYGLFLAFHFPSLVDNVVRGVGSGTGNTYKFFNNILFMSLFALIIGFFIEVAWHSYVFIRNKRNVSEKFIDALESENRFTTIGYFHKNIDKALHEIVEKVILSEGIWEICYLGAFGTNEGLLRIPVKSSTDSGHAVQWRREATLVREL